jgi:hypothetical protein
MDREVALCRVESSLELVEVRRVGVCEVRHDPEPHAPVNDIVDAIGIIGVVEHRLKCDGPDLPSVQQKLQLLVEKSGRQRKHEPAVVVARGGPETGLVTIASADRGVNDCRFVSSGEDKPGPAVLEDDKPNNVHRREPDRELHRKAVGYAMQAQSTDSGDGVSRAVAFRFDTESPLVERTQRFFSSREQADLAALPLHERRDAFFRCWSRKEALIKARGYGLSLPLHRFDVGSGRESLRCFPPAAQPAGFVCRKPRKVSHISV